MKFAEYPHLAPAVTSIKFSAGSTREGNPDDDERSFVEDLVLDNDATRRLIPRLHNLCELELVGFRMWDSLDQVTVSLMKGLRSLKVIDTSLDPDHLLDLVDSMPNLRALDLTRLYLKHESDPALENLRHTGELLVAPERSLAARTPPYRLQSLTLDHVQRRADIITWLLGPRFDLSSVHAVDLSWYRSSLCSVSSGEVPGKEAQFPPLHRLISFIGPHVVDLRLTLNLDPGESKSDVRASGADSCLGRLHSSYIYLAPIDRIC